MSRRPPASRRHRWRAATAWLSVALAVGVPTALALQRGHAPAPALDAAERAQVLALGPWPPVAPRDPSNRIDGHPAAVAFGEALFHSASLSRTPGVRCASCHEPWRRFTDGRTRALGATEGDRNTPTLLNIGLQRWFGWDGANDTLWAQSLRPLLDPREMGADARFVAAALRRGGPLREQYRRAIGHAPGPDDEQVMVDAAKAMAAYQATLWSPRTPFDEFRDGLARGDGAAAARYPVDALRGLRLFVGAAGCVSCHAGPGFSDGAFHRVPGPAIGGRAEALQRLGASPFTLAGRHNDGAAPRPPQHGEPGAWRTPGLREVAATPPYMHDGRVASLCDAVQAHAVHPALAAAPALGRQQRQDLVAFLRTLGAGALPPDVVADRLRCAD